MACAVGGGIEEISSLLAPFIGGVITDKLSWRYCFYISLPLGFITFSVVGVFFQNPGASPYHALPYREKIARLDLTGTVLLIPSIVCLLLALQFGGTRFGWSDSRIISMLVLFVLLLGGFAWYQWRGQDNATFPLRIMKQRSIISGTWFVLCNNSALSIVQYYVRFFPIAQLKDPVTDIVPRCLSISRL